MKFKVGDKVRILKRSEYEKFLESKKFGDFILNQESHVYDYFLYDAEYISRENLWGKKDLIVITDSKTYKYNLIIVDKKGNKHILNYFLLADNCLSKKINKLLNV